MFELDEERRLVGPPGYGYAKVFHWNNEIKSWQNR